MMNTDKQRASMLAREGGIADDGMDVDPISGNEVPSGSMAEEVRDDIPAQLSGGEYVVSADVLRYYGVAFFEKLRAKAKRGLAEMEAGGRIGGEPVPMRNGMEMEDEEDDLDDEDEMMLNEVMGMAQGGMMTSQPQQANNYYGLQPTMNIDRQTVSAFQQGGMAVDVNNPAASAAQFTSAFDPTKYGPGFMLQQTQQPATTGTAAAVEMRTYVNAQGEIRMIPFQNGVNLEPIPEGFYPQGQVPATTQVQQKQPDDDKGDGYRDSEPAKPYSEYTAEDWSNYTAATPFASGLAQGIAGAIGTAIGGPLGGLAGSNLAAEAIARDGIHAYNALNDFVGNMSTSDPRYDDLYGKVTEMYGALSAEAKKNPGIIGGIIEKFFGKTDITPPKTGKGTGVAAGATTGGGAGTTIDTSAAAIQKAAAATGAGAKTRTAQDQKLGAAAREGGEGGGGTGTGGGTAGGSTGGGGTSGGGTASAGASGAGAPGKAGSEVGAGPGGSDAVGPMAKGGLMVKKRVAKKAAKKRPIKTTDA